jgi:hypothetical protein
MTLQILLKEALAGKNLRTGASSPAKPLPLTPRRRRRVIYPGPWFAFDTRCGRVARRSNLLPNNTWKHVGSPDGYRTAHDAMCA